MPGLPDPKPLYEIWVYSPRFEGIHLRGGKVARGGLRWSDRPDDFRTEVLGLVKAQMVKNTVIVPVGSKGGFVLKKAPPASDRDAFLKEGIACYQDYLRGLLDLTDNLVGGKTVPPPQVVRIDGDDPYLVVAADKGTATFSDHANAISAEYTGWATPSPPAAARATTTRPWASPRAAPGKASSATSASSASTRSRPTSPWRASATCRATCSATACCCRGTSGWSRPSTTATSSSTPNPMRPRPSPSASACSSCRAPPGPTTTPS